MLAELIKNEGIADVAIRFGFRKYFQRERVSLVRKFIDSAKLAGTNLGLFAVLLRFYGHGLKPLIAQTPFGIRYRTFVVMQPGPLKS